MTTVRQVKPIYRRLIDLHPEYVEKNPRFILQTPVHHFANGIFIERCSDADRCYPRWFVSALFRLRRPTNMPIGTYFENLERPKDAAVQLWKWSDPTMIADAIAVIEAVGLPKIDLYGTPEGYATLPERHHWIHYEPREDRMLVHIAVGDLDAARTIWREQEPIYRGNTYHPDSLMHRWQAQLAAVADPLLAGDKPALAKILHGWEAANVRGTEIERHWEPTPFPLEL